MAATGVMLAPPASSPIVAAGASSSPCRRRSAGPKTAQAMGGGQLLLAAFRGAAGGSSGGGARDVDLDAAWEPAGFGSAAEARAAAADGAVIAASDLGAAKVMLTLHELKQLSMLAPGLKGVQARAYFAAMEEVAFHALQPSATPAAAPAGGKQLLALDSNTAAGAASCNANNMTSVLMRLLSETDALKGRVSALSALISSSSSSEKLQSQQQEREVTPPRVGKGGEAAAAAAVARPVDEVVVEFVRECVERSGDSRHVLQMKVAYEAYWAFCLANNHEPRQRKDFKADMVQVLGKYIPQNGRLCNFWKGVHLVPEAMGL
jgi:hypothetical protein